MFGATRIIQIIKFWKQEKIIAPEYYMKRAANIAKKSTCSEVHWGAILVKDGKIIGRGFNNVSRQELYRHCKPICIREGIRSCTQQEMCSATHAEANAIDDALEKYGHKVIKNSDMYIYGYRDHIDIPIVMRYYPCMTCALKMIQYSVHAVWFYQPTADPNNEEEMKWLPYDAARPWAKYLPNFITGDQLWWHPGHWLGLEGHDIDDINMNDNGKYYLRIYE